MINCGKKLAKNKEISNFCSSCPIPTFRMIPDGVPSSDLEYACSIYLFIFIFLKIIYKSSPSIFTFLINKYKWPLTVYFRVYKSHRKRKTFKKWNFRFFSSGFPKPYPDKKQCRTRDVWKWNQIAKNLEFFNFDYLYLKNSNPKIKI